MIFFESREIMDFSWTFSSSGDINLRKFREVDWRKNNTSNSSIGKAASKQKLHGLVSTKHLVAKSFILLLLN
jgi:hypothetical protein